MFAIKILSSFNHLNDLFTLAGESNVSFWGIAYDEGYGEITIDGNTIFNVS